MVKQFLGTFSLTDLTEQTIEGLYLTNTTYAYNSMRDGDSFAKKFGGDTGDDPDFFKLDIQGYKNGELTENLVAFYLADFRFENNAEDYIVDTWEWVDLTALGPVDSLFFTLSASDIGGYGINTPLFFCMDDLTINIVSVFDTPKPLTTMNVFPNPTSSSSTIDLQSFDNQLVTIEIFHLNGQLISTFQTTNSHMETIDLSNLNSGNYLLKAFSNEQIAVQRIAKY